MRDITAIRRGSLFSQFSMTMGNEENKDDMSKIELNETNSGYNLQKINNNFKKIATEFNEKVLYRDSPGGEPNEMQNDLDMNGNRIYNLPTPKEDHEAARLKDVQDAVAGNVNANLIQFEPTEDISSTNVQAAIEETFYYGGKNLRQELADVFSTSKGASIIGRAVVSVPDIQTMKHLDVSGITNSQTFIVKQYSESQPYGGGEFFWSENNNETPDGGNVFSSETSETGRWVRINRSYSDDTFGIPNNGIVTEHLQRLFDSAPPGSNVQITRNHEVHTQILIQKPLKVSGGGSISCEDYTVPDNSPEPESLVLVAGTQNDQLTTMSSGLKRKGLSSFSLVDASMLNAGDTLYLLSTEEVANGRPQSYKRQHVEIAEVNGNSIKIRQPLAYRYESGATVSVFSPNYIDGFIWDNVSVSQQIGLDSFRRAISFVFCKNSTITNSKFEGGSRSTLSVVSCFNVSVHRCEVYHYTERDALQYGCMFTMSSYCSASESLFYSTRTAFDISNSDNCRLIDSNLSGNMNTHVGTDHVMRGNKVEGSCLIRSQDTSVIECDIALSELTNNSNAGVIFLSESGLNGGIKIINNNLLLAHPNESETPSINISGSPSGTTAKSYNQIIGNTITSVSDQAGRIVVGSASAAAFGQKCQIIGNHINVGSTNTVILASRTDGLLVQGNTVINHMSTNGSMIQMFESGGATGIRVSVVGNLFIFANPSGTKRVFSVAGDSANAIRKILYVGNTCENDNAPSIFDGVPAGRLLNANNLTDS